MAVVAHVRHVEGEDLILLARPEAGGSTLTRTEVSAATLEVFDPESDTPDTALDTKVLLLTGDPDGSDDECMFSAAQTDDLWDLDGGYTFVGFVRDSEQHLDGGKTYRVEVSLTAGHSTPTWPQQAAYGVLIYIWHVTVVPTAGA